MTSRALFASLDSSNPRRRSRRPRWARPDAARGLAVNTCRAVLPAPRPSEVEGGQAAAGEGQPQRERARTGPARVAHDHGVAVLARFLAGGTVTERMPQVGAQVGLWQRRVTRTRSS